MNAGRLLQRLIVQFVLVGALIFTLAPIAFMFTASLMPSAQIVKMPYRWIPTGIHTANFVKAIAGNDGRFMFIRNIINSLVVALSVSVTTVLLSSLTGYSLAKFSYRGRNFVFMMIMATMMIPFEAIMIPLYMVVTRMGLQNSYSGLILPFLVNAFGVFMMRSIWLPFRTSLSTRHGSMGWASSRSIGRLFCRIPVPRWRHWQSWPFGRSGIISCGLS